MTKSFHYLPEHRFSDVADADSRVLAAIHIGNLTETLINFRPSISSTHPNDEFASKHLLGDLERVLLR
jgi:hypothetical protein